MRPDQASRWLSELRFQNFLDACNGDHSRAVALYNWNAEVSAAFLEILHHVEVILRNAIDRQFPPTPTLQVVSICSSDVWLTDPSTVEPAGREKVNDAITRLLWEGRRVTRGRVIASLAFGFWRALFSGRYEDLWRSHLMGAFPNGNGRRRQVNELLARILPFRNRIAHHEAIFAWDLKKQQEQQIELTSLIDPEAGIYIAALSRVDKLLMEKP